MITEIFYYRIMAEYAFWMPQVNLCYYDELCTAYIYMILKL